MGKYPAKRAIATHRGILIVSRDENPALYELARQAGILTVYTDIEGKAHIPSPDSLVAILRAMGIPFESPEDIDFCISWLKDNYLETTDSSVIVAWDGKIPEHCQNFEYLEPESAGGEICPKFLPGQILPFGYYHAESNLIISAPSRCYKNPDKGKRLGLFAPFYALRSKSSWGVGDYSDARELIRQCGRRNVDLVGTLPISAQFLDSPCEPSPYQPMSRLFWNELFIDPRRLPEFSTSTRAHRLVASSAFEKERRDLANSPLIDYRRVAKLKRQVMEILAEEFWNDSDSPRRRALLKYIDSNPDIKEFAEFCANRESSGEPDKKQVQFNLYSQWIAREQLEELIAEGKSAGVELYLDLPLGSHPDGFDHWKYRDQFVSNVSIGAPPDPLGPEGQVWGIPPINPFVSRRAGHPYFRELIHRHTAIAGMLRIDHVMGLHRLFWVPDGFPGSEGVYVKYPADDFWAILSLESHLNRCEIVGEDLGTVPDEVRQAMNLRNARQLYVQPFEVNPDRQEPVKAPSIQSVASLNTHDLVPFAGFWRESDIYDRFERGWLDTGQEHSARDERDRFRRIIKRKLTETGDWREDHVDEATTAIRAAHSFLASSEAEIVLINIEDLWSETEPQNRPGTVDPVPNWRRKLARTVDGIFDDPGITDHIKDLIFKRGREDIMAGKKTVRGEKTSTSKTKRGSKVTSEFGSSKPVIGQSMPIFRLTADDRYLFNEGSHLRLYEKLGSHTGEIDGVKGTHFAVWAPDAESVHVISDFNGWNRESHPLFPNNSSGIWEGFIPGAETHFIYKYFVRSRFNGYCCEKADPFAFHAETSPKTGSIVWDNHYDWGDEEWMKKRNEINRLNAPASIYEMHPGSWRRVVEQGERSLNYRELAEQLPGYLTQMGFTHVEFLPLMEHPFYGSWGYQTTGYFAPTSRYGTPQDLKFLIDTLHQNGIGVILDWVPSHFPSDEHGLAFFDGTHLYEHADEKQGFHPDWRSMIFNYGRNEVRSFLLSSGMFWLDQYHVDGLRVDAVASMLYLDYSRKAGEWIPNRYGGRENLDAISFLRRFNEEVYAHFPDVQVIAEESTSWPAVSRPTYLGGLGFGFKWDMGWMHDVLDYFSRDPIHRRFHHNALTFRMLYAWHENFILPLSHDEVVHGKGSLIGRMPGDLWQKFANLRLLLTVQYTQPGKKLLFMGSEIGQWAEWNHDRSLDWHLLEYPNHLGLQRLVSDLNRVYRNETALHQVDSEPGGFEWVDCNDAEGSTISYLRWNRDYSECILVVLNFTPVTRFDYRVGIPRGGVWRELLNSDSEHYAGSGKGNLGEVYSTGEPFHGRPDSVIITLPPLGGVILKG